MWGTMELLKTINVIDFSTRCNILYFNVTIFIFITKQCIQRIQVQATTDLQLFKPELYTNFIKLIDIIIILLWIDFFLLPMRFYE